MGLEEREHKRKSVVGSMVESPGKEKGRSEDYLVRSYKITIESHKKIKLRALKEGKKDYEIVQDALNSYLE